MIGFKVEIDALTATSVLNNTAAVGGTAVSNSGAFVMDAAGNRVTASDDSSSERCHENLGSCELKEVGITNLPVPPPVPTVRLTKKSSDAISNGDNWDVTFTLALRNSGAVTLDKVEVFDDLAAAFGGQLAGVTLDRVTCDPTNTGSALVGNSGFAADTSMSLVTSTGPVEVGDAFEIVFTVTIDPNVDGTAASGLECQASAICEAVDVNGHSIVNLVRSRTLSQADGDNGRASATGGRAVERTVADKPTPVVMADIAVVKSIAGPALPLPNENFEVAYQLVIANTGNVDLVQLTLVEDLADQFGSVLVSAGNVTLATPPSESRSSVTLDKSWNGDGKSEMLDQAEPSLLVAGDSFTVQFTVEVEPSEVGTSSKPENPGAVSEKEVHPVQEDLSISNDGEIVAADFCDTEASPAAPSEDIPTAQLNRGMIDDPMPSEVPDLTIARAIVGAPVLTGLGNYVVTGQLVIENTGNIDLADLSLLENLSVQFGRGLVKAGNLTIISSPSGSGSNVSVDSAGWNGKISTELLDSSAPNVLVTGDSFTVQFEVEINPNNVLAPQENQRFGSIEITNVSNGQSNSGAAVPIGNLIEDFCNAPGPIYSGRPVNQNSNPQPINKSPLGSCGYSLSAGSIFTGV